MSLTRFAAFGGLLVVAVSSLVFAVRGDKPAPPKDAPPAFKAPPTAFECRWTDGPITLDGKGDEEAWKHAQVIDNFYLPWLGKNARAAKTATKAKLLWDREFLYFFADMEDTDLFAIEKKHNGMTWEDDVFELFFKPADDKPGYYEFQVNAAGTIMDMFLPRRGAGGYRRFINDTTFHLEAKVHLRGTLNKWTDKDEGWSVEGRIPWKDFVHTGGAPKEGDSWKFALCRYDYSVDFEGPELSTCAPLKSKSNPDFHHFEDYASLKFIGPAKEKEAKAKPFGIDKRVPLTTSKVVGSPEPPPPYRAVRAYPKLKMDFPVFVAAQPGSDRLLIITEGRSYGPTKLARMKDDPDATEMETLFTWEDGVAYSLEFHPQFTKNGLLFIGWNGTLPGDKVKKTRITRLHMDPKPPYKLDKDSATEILAVVSDGHNGGALAFGHDGMLYVTTGDGTSDSDTNVVGQRMDTLLAKLLRIDVDHTEGEPGGVSPRRNYAVPKDNPFVGMKDARPETWSYGYRNPWRLTVDKKTGHIWLGQNGQDLWEQAYLVKKGDNAGWSVMEGSHEFYLNRKPGPTPFVKPTVEHPHSEFRSLTGGIVYYGAKHPALQGAYLYGDYSTGQIWGIKHDGTKALWNKELASTTLAITSFGTDTKGELLISDHRGKGEGGLYRLEPTPKEAALPPFPKKLSDSGLFRSVKGHVMEPAMIPYSVNAQLWSDGAYKERWLGLPGADPKIDMKSKDGWDFPDKTIVVKSFALEREPGKAESRRWIETRFLTKQDGQWYGYSYAWNDEQTEATLVAREGENREFAVGAGKQKWRYPSRNECMVCHSRAANFVLGLSTVQMNKVHDYGGVKDEQLRVLGHLGVLKVTEKNNKMLVDPYDKSQPLDARARSYLHANCAICHVEAGGGNAQFTVDFLLNADKLKLFDVKPQHNTYGLKDARLIAPGAPERSVLLHRMATRDQGHMPPLASFLVDREAVDMLREWVRKMEPK
jgi:uncharacterized repeat protein (TIGR03806 family)